MTEEGARNTTSVAVISDEEDTEPRRLNLAKVDVYGKQVRTLFDSGAIPYIMSVAILDRLDLSPRKKSRSITMRGNKETLVVGVVVAAPVTVGPIPTELARLVVRSSP